MFISVCFYFTASFPIQAFGIVSRIQYNHCCISQKKLYCDTAHVQRKHFFYDTASSVVIPEDVLRFVK